jgi:hypothetical protein
LQGKAAASASVADGSQAPGLVGSLGHSLASQSHLLNWADKTFGQGLTSLTKGMHKWTCWMPKRGVVET